jgi:hypothetical protein
MMNETKTRLGLKLLEVFCFSYEISNSTEHDVFFSYSPHVDNFSLSIYENGWEYEKESSFKIISEEINDRNLDKALNVLEEYYEKYCQEVKE